MRSVGELRRPMESLRREVDRLFEDFDRDFWRCPFRRTASMLEPFWRGEEGLAPAVEIVEGEKAYKVTAELPRMDDKDIEVTLTDDVLIIKGEKRRRRKRRRRTIVSVSATMARSSALLRRLKASMRTRSKRGSRRAC